MVNSSECFNISDVPCFVHLIRTTAQTAIHYGICWSEILRCEYIKVHMHSCMHTHTHTHTHTHVHTQGW